MTPQPLPSRPCGPCTVCCTAKPIDVEPLVKAPGVTCRHCTGSGCGVYDARPQLCRDYLCAWKWLEGVPQDMRPDRSGLLIDVDREHETEPYRITVLAWRGGEDFTQIAPLMAGWIEAGVPVWLSRPGPPGMLNAKLHANPGFAEAVRTRDYPQFLAALNTAVDALDRHDWQPFEG